MVALGSVWVINHFAGDYEHQDALLPKLHRRPARSGGDDSSVFFPRLSFRFPVGYYARANSFFIPFLLLGLVGVIEKELRALFAVMLAYMILHFVVLPNWQERWLALSYLACGICSRRIMPKSRSRARTLGIPYT